VWGCENPRKATRQTWGHLHPLAPPIINPISSTVSPLCRTWLLTGGPRSGRQKRSDILHSARPILDCITSPAVAAFRPDPAGLPGSRPLRQRHPRPMSGWVGPHALRSLQHLAADDEISEGSGRPDSDRAAFAGARRGRTARNSAKCVRRKRLAAASSTFTRRSKVFACHGSGQHWRFSGSATYRGRRRPWPRRFLRARGRVIGARGGARWRSLYRVSERRPSSGGSSNSPDQRRQQFILARLPADTAFDAQNLALRGLARNITRSGMPI